MFEAPKDNVRRLDLFSPRNHITNLVKPNDLKNRSGRRACSRTVLSIWGGSSVSRMGHEIEKRDGICEVRLFGDVSKFEILLIVAKLSLKDPGKKHPDLWIIGAEVQIPYARFKGISEGIRFAHVKPPASRRTAIVAADEFQKAQCELYRLEAIAALPLDVRVFLSYEEAVAWVKSPECPTAT